MGIFLYTALTSSIGVIILLAFFAMAVSPAALEILLPVIVSFNSAIAGYTLIDKGGVQLPGKKVYLIAMATTLGIAGCLALFLLYPWEPLLDGGRYLSSGMSALAMIFFGAWIATKSKKLNQKNALTTDEEER